MPIEAGFGCFTPLGRPEGSPVRWRPFTAAAFREAAALDRLMFLVIGAAWCPYSQRFLHWLHNDPVAMALLNDAYVPILVDAEERPDVLARYSAGGWPSLQVLDPTGATRWAGMHVPDGKLTPLLEAMQTVHAAGLPPLQPLSVQDEAAGDEAGSALPAGPSIETIVDAVVQKTLAAFDPTYDGFTLEPEYAGPKFPHLDAVDLLLRVRDAEGRAKKIAGAALARLMHKGLWDREAGGLRRYAALRDWGAIHGEKLLWDQAQLLQMLCLAAQEFDDAVLRAQARSVLDWTLHTLDLDGVVFRSGVRSAHHDVPTDWPVPPSNSAILVDANAQMASALLRASGELHDASAAVRAMALLDRLWEQAVDPRWGVAHRLADGRTTHAGYAATSAQLGIACVDAVEVCKAERFAERAIWIFEDALRRFRQGEGTFVDVEADAAAAGRLQTGRCDLPLSASMAEFALRLFRATGDDSCEHWTREALTPYLRTAQEAGPLAARFAMAALVLTSDTASA